MRMMRTWKQRSQVKLHGLTCVAFPHGRLKDFTIQQKYRTWIQAKVRFLTCGIISFFDQVPSFIVA